MKLRLGFCIVLLASLTTACNLFERPPTPTAIIPTITPTAPTASPSPPIAALSTTPAETPTSSPTSPPRRLTFPRGATAITVDDNLPANGMQTFVLRALANQTMIVSASSTQAHVLLQIAGADGVPLKTFGAGSAKWSGVLPATQDYTIAITTEDGSAAAYSVQISIPPLGAESAGGTPKRIQFQTGNPTAMIQGNLAPNGNDVYVLKGAAGQTLTVSAVSAETRLLLQISGADGSPLKSSGAGSSSWAGTLPTTQDYVLRITSENGTGATYTLQVGVSPFASP